MYIVFSGKLSMSTSSSLCGGAKYAEVFVHLPLFLGLPKILKLFDVQLKGTLIVANIRQ
jgi:hypothetical protein